MADFQTAYAITKKIEGGWHDGKGINANDRGGETFKGIARKIWNGWEGWPLIDGMKSQNNFPKVAEENTAISALVHKFYKTHFWDVNRLDEIKFQPLANELFDTGVNAGTTTAARMLQRALNLLNRNERSWKEIGVDGNLGPATLLAANLLKEVDQKHLFNLMNILQGNHYVMIIEKDRTQEENIRGWMSRIESMR